MDFKFRTLEMLEIFVKKAKNPENFLVCVTPLLDTLKDSLSDSKKQVFIEKYEFWRWVMKIIGFF